MTKLAIDAAHLIALQNLHKKQQGRDVGFINIASARALTELGLAVRTAQGWEINQAGIRFLTET